MTYAKPEVTVLGDAIALIENTTIKGGKQVESASSHPSRGITPAYDLDD
jgi:hypothetical protein